MDQSGECAERTQSRDFALQLFDFQRFTPPIRGEISGDGGLCTSTHRALSDGRCAKCPTPRRGIFAHRRIESRFFDATSYPPNLCAQIRNEPNEPVARPSPGEFFQLIRQDSRRNSRDINALRQRTERTQRAGFSMSIVASEACPVDRAFRLVRPSRPSDVGRPASTKLRFICTGKRRTYETNPTAQFCVETHFVPLRCVVCARHVLWDGPLGRTPRGSTLARPPQLANDRNRAAIRCHFLFSPSAPIGRGVEGC
jgi:hypothetical protein